VRSPLRLRQLLARLLVLSGIIALGASAAISPYLSKDELITLMSTALAVILIDGLVIWAAMHRVVIGPIGSVAADARAVTAGDLHHAVITTGPREVAELAGDIEAMRLRILEEVDQARQLNAELSRSNEELEQFAYVASHDLQEPLRKVTSFCQLLAQRYQDKLDERGQQYIDFAVDGAKRMQVLINDLLAFSRIGRTTERFAEVDLGDCAEMAVRNLSAAIEQTEAGVSIDPDLPTVHGDRSLLIALMQNLIGNALKFHGDDPPAVKVSAEEGDEEFTISVTDNGIGVEPRFADRIFVIFQRLHGRDAYSGTGIGLAMCRKIVEFHGGRIWLNTAYGPGAQFCFTLPRVATTEEPVDEPDDTILNAG
jgi:light-regulated signal transduction histidine kinase (bacteriophytochrome)